MRFQLNILKTYTQMSLLSLFSERVEYLSRLLNGIYIKGSHDSSTDIRGDLGLNMMRLKGSSHGDDEVENILHNIYDTLELKISFQDFHYQYESYLRILSQREERIDASQNNWWYKLGEVPNLKKTKWNFWGSIKQLQSGKCIADCLNKEYGCNLHPIWGSLLNPTSGIVGAGNNELINRDWDSYVSLHGCVHDACGYLINYHKIGPGYNYLETYWTFFGKTSPMSCQFYGLYYWKNQCY